MYATDLNSLSLRKCFTYLIPCQDDRYSSIHQKQLPPDLRPWIQEHTRNRIQGCCSAPSEVVRLVELVSTFGLWAEVKEASWISGISGGA